MNAYVVDTETTDTESPIPVQVSVQGVWVGDADVLTVGHLETKMYNPGKPISFGAMATHGITDEHVASCDPWVNFTYVGDVEYLIGHNVDFDWKALGEPNIKRICTLALARKVWPELDSHKLFAILFKVAPAHASRLFPKAHDAETDVIACSMVLSAIVDAMKPMSIEDLHDMSEAARIPTHMAVGKHKGKAMEDLPMDYIQWFLKQSDVDQYLRHALQSEYERRLSR